MTDPSVAKIKADMAAYAAHVAAVMQGEMTSAAMELRATGMDYGTARLMAKLLVGRAFEEQGAE